MTTRRQVPCVAYACANTTRQQDVVCLAHRRIVPAALLDELRRKYATRKRGGRYEADYANARKAVERAVREWESARAAFAVETQVAAELYGIADGANG